MIGFKKNIKKILPYDRDHYIDFLGDDFDSFTKWNGISFQLNTQKRKIDLEQYIAFYEPLFKNVILNFDTRDQWIVNLNYKDEDWFPNNEDNLINLRTLFKQNNIPNTYRGALIFHKDDLLEFSKDILSYPSTVFNEDGILYCDLDISNSELQFVVKISGHMNIDFLSTDKELLRRVVRENSSNIFNVKEYRGTSLSLK